MLAVSYDIKYRAQVSKVSIFVGDSTAIARFFKVRSNCLDVCIVLQASGPAVGGTQQYRQSLEKHIPADATFHLHPPTKWSALAMIYFTPGAIGPLKMVLHNQVSYPLGIVSVTTFTRLSINL
jgi:hypothetical protein